MVWWIAAEDSAFIGDQMVTLAVALGLVEPGSDAAIAVPALKAYLRRHDSWLLLFDNAELPSAVSSWLPGGTGHIIITTRSPGWDHLAATVEVDVMTRTDSVTLLRAYHPDLSEADASRLADALGDLPLALVQAAGFLTTTGTNVDEYLGLLRMHTTQVMNEGAGGAYPRTLSAAITISMHRLTDTNPAALAVLQVCAMLAPEPVPTDWLSSLPPIAHDDRAVSRASSVAEPVALRQSIAKIGSYGLATITTDGIWLHRLTQAVLRDQLPIHARFRIREQAETVLAANRPHRTG